jgi:hypothetical protein
MNYVFNQALAINSYDAENHILKGGVFVNDCSPFGDVADATEKRKQCRSWVGPNQPGVNFPDGSEQQETRKAASHRHRRTSAARPAPAPPGAAGLGVLAPRPQPDDAPQPAPPAQPPLPQLPQLPPLPDLPLKQAPAPPLLDYLLGG